MKYVSEEELRKWLITDGCAEGHGYIDEDDFVCMDWQNNPIKTGHWIPVSERMPNNEEDVLVYSCRHGIDIQYHDDAGWHDIHNDALCSETIAWMPLPEPYKAESEVKHDRDNSKAL